MKFYPSALVCGQDFLAWHFVTGTPQKCRLDGEYLGIGLQGSEWYSLRGGEWYIYRWTPYYPSVCQQSLNGQEVERPGRLDVLTELPAGNELPTFILRQLLLDCSKRGILPCFIPCVPEIFHSNLRGRNTEMYLRR